MTFADDAFHAIPTTDHGRLHSGWASLPDPPTAAPARVAPPMPLATEPAATRDGDCAPLLQACAAGDQQAFRRLYELTSARLFATIRRSVWLDAEAEEVLQDTYVKVWRHAGSFDPARSRPLTWLARIARNQAIDHLRQQRQRRQHELPQSPSADDDESAGDQRMADTSGQPHACLERAEQWRRADRLLAVLDPHQRAVILMALVDDLTQSEIAERLGAPIGTVKSWLRRGLQRLKLAEQQLARLVQVAPAEAV